jgi:hypothetical protein
MHPVIAQAIAAERARESQALAAAARHSRELRRSRLPRRTWLFMGFVRARSGPVSPSGSQPLRGPRAA